MKYIISSIEPKGNSKTSVQGLILRPYPTRWEEGFQRCESIIIFTGSRFSLVFSLFSLHASVYTVIKDVSEEPKNPSLME